VGDVGGGPQRDGLGHPPGDVLDDGERTAVETSEVSTSAEQQTAALTEVATCMDTLADQATDLRTLLAEYEDEDAGEESQAAVRDDDGGDDDGGDDDGVDDEDLSWDDAQVHDGQ
jgi:methyl-accepting chemotaxis protein